MTAVDLSQPLTPPDHPPQLERECSAPVKRKVGRPVGSTKKKEKGEINISDIDFNIIVVKTNNFNKDVVYAKLKDIKQIKKLKKKQKEIDEAEQLKWPWFDGINQDKPDGTLMLKININNFGNCPDNWGKDVEFVADWTLIPHSVADINGYFAGISRIKRVVEEDDSDIEVETSAL